MQVLGTRRFSFDYFIPIISLPPTMSFQGGNTFLSNLRAAGAPSEKDVVKTHLFSVTAPGLGNGGGDDEDASGTGGCCYCR